MKLKTTLVMIVVVASMAISAMGLFFWLMSVGRSVNFSTIISFLSMIPASYTLSKTITVLEG